MKIKDFTHIPTGTRIRVTGVAMSESEALGYVHDTETLMGRTGTVVGFNPHVPQAMIAWDEPGTSLSLASHDEIELLP